MAALPSAHAGSYKAEPGEKAIGCGGGVQVLSEPGWCYVVKLAATGGMALTSADLAPGGGDTALTSADLAPGVGGAAPAASNGPLASSAAEGNSAGDMGALLQERLAAVRLRNPEPAPDSPAGFDDPLRRPAGHSFAPAPAADGGAPAQERAQQPAHQAALGADGRGKQIMDRGSVPLFTGFVSHEQLEEVMGSRCARCPH